MHFALNARDWIMSYYSATGLASAEESMRGGRAVKDNESGKPTFVFFTKLPGAGKADIGNDVELPDGVDSNLFGEVRINGFTALAKYVAWRVSLGDIPEVTDVKEVEVDIMQTLSRAAAKEGKKPVDTPEEKENKEAVEKGIQSDHRVDAPLFGSLLGECFGSQWVQIIHILSGHDGSLKVSIGGKEVEITSESELLDYLHKAIEEKQNLLQQLKETSKELGTKQAVKYFINALKKVALEQDMLTPDLLKVQVAAPGAQDVIFQKPKAKSAPAPKPVVDSPSEDIV